MNPAKKTATALSPAATCDAAATAAVAVTATIPSNPKLYKCEDIPLTISASLAKQSSSMRTRAKKTSHSVIDDYGIKTTSGDQHHQDSNDSNDDEIDYTYTAANANPYIYYSTMSANGGDYLRKTTGHLHHRNVNNNSTIASTNGYRWHNQSDEIALQSMRNNSHTIAPSTTTTTTTKPNAMTMHSNYRAHSSSNNRKQHHLNQINNNFIVTNKKQPVNAQNSIDQNNGNYYPSRLYH